MTGSQALITVVDHRRYPFEIAHPGFGVYRTSRVHKLEAASLSHVGSGAASILASGDSITYEADLQPGRRAIVQTQFDGLGQSLEAIQVGAQALTDILARFGAGSGRKAVDDFAKLLSIRSCADALGKGSGALISGCFDPKDMLEAFGAKGLLLAPVMAIGGVVAFLHGQWNALVDQFNNHDKYMIVLTRTASPPPPPTTTARPPPTTSIAPPPTSTAPAEPESAPTCDSIRGDGRPAKDPGHRADAGRASRHRWRATRACLGVCLLHDLPRETDRRRLQRRVLRHGTAVRQQTRLWGLIAWCGIGPSGRSKRGSGPVVLAARRSPASVLELLDSRDCARRLVLSNARRPATPRSSR
jgi:hypothetical protein